MFAAGTDADVFIVLYGQNGLGTQQKHLCVNERERRLYFERAAEDMFIVEVRVWTTEHVASLYCWSVDHHLITHLHTARGHR